MIFSKENSSVPHPSSFRDPEGFVFTHSGILYRQVNHKGRENFDLLNSSGLYKKFQSEKKLIPHEEMDGIGSPAAASAYKILKPELIPFISYPYEWSFSQLKDAAILTLDIQLTALSSGMTLKDASAFNIQFLNNKPIHIDTLSFEKYTEGEAWIAYKQFCEHFLAPLALMKYTDILSGRWSQIYLDGIPLALTTKLLPWKTWLNFTLLSNIHLHARYQKQFSGKPGSIAKKKLSKQNLIGIVSLLRSFISGLKWEPNGTEWGNYYSDTNYDKNSFEKKRSLVSEFIDLAGPVSLLDVGANSGLFSRLASEKGIFTVSTDIDPAAVDKNYLEVKAKEQKNIIPLVANICNPVPAIGWDNKERNSFIQRASSDCVMMLALIHHLCISNNLPFQKVAALASSLGKTLIIEFVPKNDSQVQRLLASRKDIFDSYTQENFEFIFSELFNIEKKSKVDGSERTLYFMRRKN